MAGVDVVRFAVRNARSVYVGAVRWLGNGKNCRLNDTGSVYDLG